MKEAENYKEKLHALYINCSLKKKPEESHTQTLMQQSVDIMYSQDIETEIIRLADYRIEATIDPEMKDDDWPEIYEKILKTDILIIGSPIWLGEKSSMATKLIERIYAHSAETNDAGQYIYYNKVGGVLVTGNEDGAKHVARDLLYSLSHVGFTVPPQADAYWVGEAGPGPSYADAGQDNEFTKRNTRIMSWNLIHFAQMLKTTPIPPQGNTVDSAAT